MRTVELKLFVCLIVFLVGLAPVALGDWNHGDDHKMHFPQEPDREGWDVCVCCQSIADDFMCSRTGPIKDIHIWCSWKGDELGDPDLIDLDISIWSDKPGEPNELLWRWNGQGNVALRPYGTGEQGWFCPSSPPPVRPDHYQFYQVNITEIPEPFRQVRGTVYWLVVRANIPADPWLPVGWKTSRDDPPGPLWGNPAMWSPDGIDWKTVDTGDVISRKHDMAFVITGPEPIIVVPPVLRVGPWVVCEDWHRWIGPPEDISIGKPVQALIPDPCELIAKVDFFYSLDGVNYVQFGSDADGNEPREDTTGEHPADGDGWTAYFLNDLPTTGQPMPVYFRAVAHKRSDGPITVETDRMYDPTPPDSVTLNVQDWQEVEDDTLEVDVNPILADIARILVWVELKPLQYVKGIPEIDQKDPDRQYGGEYHCAPTAAAACLKYFENQGDDEVCGGLTSSELVDALAELANTNVGGAGTSVSDLAAAIAAWITNHGDGYTVRGPEAFDWQDIRDEFERSQDVLLGIYWPGGGGHRMTMNSIVNIPLANDKIRVDFMDPYGGVIGYGDLDTDTGELDNFTGPSGNRGQLGNTIIVCPEESDSSGDPPADHIVVQGPDPQPVGVALPHPGLYKLNVVVVDQSDHAHRLIRIVERKEADDIKWIQRPDNTETGIDIRVDDSDGIRRVMADDFECTKTELITDVHIWGSWKNDHKGRIENIHLSIHKDDPVGPGGSDPNNTFSKPDTLVWDADFGEGEFDEVEDPCLFVEEGEYWWDPVNNEWIPNGDKQIWRIDIDIDPCDAYRQRGSADNPITYWLDVQVSTEYGEFGWKTRRPDRHYKDDAVWAKDDVAAPNWRPLHYPIGHPLHGSVFLDFEDLTSGSIYYVGDTFTTSGVTIAVGQFQYSDTTWTNTGSCTVATGGQAGGSGNEMQVNNVNLSFNLPSPLLNMSLLFADGGGNLNIKINGDFRNFEDFSDIDGLTIGGVKVDVTGLDKGCLYLSGTINDFAIGGQELFIDNVKSNSIDMAFALTTGEPELEPKEPVPHLKWSQPPIEIDPNAETPTYCGWDEPSFQEYDFFWHGVADDFRCLGTMPVTSLHWWGSYVGWDEPEPPMRQPSAWAIGFWSNVPEDPTQPASYSYPETLLKYFVLPADRVQQEYVGEDWFPNPLGPIQDACFQYYVDLHPKEWFWQGLDSTGTVDPDNIYWLSIVAIYGPDQPIPPYPWGWKTRPWHWMDDAVRFDIDLAGTTHIVLNPDQVQPIDDPLTGESMDVAFELDTDPNWIKWEQPFTGHRHWEHYEDEKSMAIETATGNIDVLRRVADDWRCDQNTPVIAAVWWGSYIGYRYRPCQTFVPAPPIKPDYFLLTIWDDIPAGVDPAVPYSHPNDVMWEYKAFEYDEVLVGYDKHSSVPGQQPGWEPVFRYSVRLPDNVWFKQKEPNDIYWFSVVAVYKAENDPQYDWGWTNHKHVFNDDAVAREHIAGVDTGWYELFDQNNESEDMSFMLFTQPCLTPGQVVGGNYITTTMYHLWVSLGKPQCWCCPCHSRLDANCDCVINAIDALALRAAWPGFGGVYDPCTDTNNDGVMNAIDALALRAAWPGFGGPGCNGVPGCP